MHIVLTTLRLILFITLIPLQEQCHIDLLLCLYAAKQIIQLVIKDTDATCNKPISYFFTAMHLLKNIFHDAQNCDYLETNSLSLSPPYIALLCVIAGYMACHKLENQRYKYMCSKNPFLSFNIITL